MFRPDRFVVGVHVLDPEDLIREGVRGVMLDLDNTLLPRFTREMPPRSSEWVAALLDAGLKVCLLSNNWHGAVSELADTLGVPFVARALKPFPMGFNRALKIMGVGRKEAAIVGDQIFTDVLGGNLAGLHTFMVEPLSQEDLPHTLLLRRMEARIMSGIEPQGPSIIAPDGEGSPTG